jgi:MYXO-CTERM domain-containing protein
MNPCGMLRLALRVSAVAGCLASLAARPALACYCVEYCSSLQPSFDAPPAVEGAAPQANTYVVHFEWTPYPGAPDDCQYSFEERETGDTGGWTPLDCELVKDAAGDVTGADCEVTAPSASDQDCVEGSCASGSEDAVATWEYGVVGTSEERPSASNSNPCTTTVVPPGSLDAPSTPETEVVPPTDRQAPRLTITWAAPLGRSVEGGRAQIQGYRVYRQADGDSTSALVGQPTETRYVDQNVSASKSYTYKIYAADQYGVGRAAVVRVEGSSVGASGCSNAGSAAGPLGLALAAVGALWRRRRSR